MGKNRGLDRLIAERLLRGEPADRSSVPEALRPLTEVLAAAAHPADGEELAGETAALAAFRKAQPYGPPAARSFRLKVAAIVMATAASTGAVAAAATGILPVDGPRDASPTIRPTVGATPVSGKPSSGSSVQPSPSPSARPSVKDSTSSRAPRGTPSASLADLCRAYINRGGQLDDPVFAALITAAGGKNLVPRFCDHLTRRTYPTRSYPTYPTYPTYPYPTYPFPSYPYSSWRHPGNGR